MNNLRRLFVLSTKCPWKPYFNESRRQIFSPRTIGLNSFSVNKMRFLTEIPNPTEFKEKMQSISNSNEELILLGDIRKMMAISDSDDDIKTLMKLLEKYVKQKESLNFQSFKLSVEVLRFFYYLNKPNDAIAFAANPVMFEEMKVFSSVLIFLDLLIKNEMYEDVIKYYEYFQPLFPDNPGPTTFLYTAACYKLNTPEHLEKALNAQLGSIKRKNLTARAAALLAGFAIKQNKPVVAIEMLLTLKDYTVGDNLMAVALSQVKRYNEVIELYNRCIEKPNFFIIAEAFDLVKSKMEESEEYAAQMVELKSKNSKIFTDRTIESYLLAEMELHRPATEQFKSRNVGQNLYRQRNERYGDQLAYNSNRRRFNF